MKKGEAALFRTKRLEERSVLTRRELEVCRWLGSGVTNAQIAVELGITYTTVKKHIRRACRSTGTDNRTHLLVHCLRNNLLTLEELY